MERIALIGLLAAFAATRVAAGPADSGVKSVSLFLKASDLSSSSEARANLERRVADAVKSLCGGFYADEIGDCRRTARAEFDARIAEMRKTPEVQLSAR